VVFKVHLIHAHAYAKWWQMLVLFVPHQKKSFWRVSSSCMTYANVVSAPAKEHNRYMAYIITYPPNGACAFNTARTSCIRYENIFTSWGKGHKTSLDPHALGAQSWFTWFTTGQTRSPYCMIGTVLMQASSWGDESRIHITRQKDTYLLTFL
jgi:hypothetical protein